MQKTAPPKPAKSPAKNRFQFDRAGWLLPAAGIKLLPTPHKNQRPDNTPVTAAVLHNISLPPLQFGEKYIKALFLGRMPEYQHEHPFFAEISQLQVSAHFFIGRKGSVIQFASIFDRAWHAGVSCLAGKTGCNDFTIGLEFNGADHIPYTLRQYQAGALLLTAAQTACPTLSTITTHSHIAPERKTDPGPAFNLRFFNRLLSQASPAPAAIVC